MKWFYNLLYSRLRAPWDLGPRQELVEVVESGHIQPCKAIDLGCGTASNAIFLAQHGFDVTGTDYSPAAIALCRQRGAAAGVTVNWIEDDLTNLQHVRGPFDLLVDWGVYDDLDLPDRRAYLRNILPLTHGESQFLIYVHQWPPRWWERPLYRLFGVAGPMQPGEVEADFGPYFNIEKLAERRSEITSPTQIPAPGLIHFDDLAHGTIIGDSYRSSHGVRFEDGRTTCAVVYGNEPAKARSQPNVASNDPVAPHISAGVPMQISFEPARTHVGMWLGNGENIGLELHLCLEHSRRRPLLRHGA